MTGQLLLDVVLLPRLSLDFLRLAVPAGTRLGMDTHDLASDNAQSSWRRGARFRRRDGLPAAGA